MQLFNKTYKHLDKQHYGKSTTGIHLFLLYASIIIFFIPLVVRVLQVKKIPVAVIPPEFNFGTILLVASSFLLYQSRALIEKDNVRTLRLSLLIALLLGLLFIFFQFQGWYQLYRSDVAPEIKIIMVLVSVHAIHFTAAMLMLLILLIPLFKLKTRADVYIFFLNGKRATAFSSNRSYWDFLGILWVVLYSIIILKSM
jgi:cytochrome c oxidase subunit III